MSDKLIDKILDVTGVDGPLLIEFIDRVEQFVLEISADMQVRNHHPSVMLGLAFAMDESQKAIVKVHKIVFVDSS